MPSRIQSPVRRRGLYALLVAGAIAGLVALGIVVAAELTANSHAADHAQLTAQRAQLTALAGKAAAIEAAQAQLTADVIAQERKQAILTECQDQNARHTATLHELHRLVDQAEKRATTRAQRRQLAASLEGSVLIIDKLAPYEKHCDQVVARFSRR